MKRIGILTWHYYENFGSALQAFALQHTTEKLGYKVRIINYRNPKFGKTTELKRKAQYYLNEISRKINIKNANFFNYPFLYFQKRYLKESAMTYSYEGAKRALKGYDTIILGSDQIWAPNVLNKIYLGDFGETVDVKKISYAASIGLNDIPVELREEYERLLKQFSSISIREEKGKEIIEKLFNIKATTVLDPTLLVDINTYKKMERAVAGIEGKYIYCYFLNKENKYKYTVLNYAQKHNLRVVGKSDNVNDYLWMEKLDGIGPCEFLWLINHATAVFTDSYHGTIFSLLYHKEMYVFERFLLNDPICQNSRIYQLDNWFKIGSRIIKEDTDIEMCEKFDFNVFEENLKIAREISMNFLEKEI